MDSRNFNVYHAQAGHTLLANKTKVGLHCFGLSFSKPLTKMIMYVIIIIICVSERMKRKVSGHTDTDLSLLDGVMVTCLQLDPTRPRRWVSKGDKNSLQAFLRRVSKARGSKS